MTHNIRIFTTKNSGWITAWKTQFCNASMLHAANIRKARGATVGLLLRMLLAAPFSGLQVWHLSGDSGEAPGRDAFYRFLGEVSYNWRRLVAMVAGRLIEAFDPLTDADRKRVLILDESPYRRNRSKKVEGLGRHYDHCRETYYRGFRMLTLGWSDGHSFVPMGMELLTNRDATKHIGPYPSADGRTCAGRSSKIARQKTNDVAEQMIRRTVEDGTGAGHLVVDSWFAQPKLLARLAKHLPVVCQLKNHPSFTYKHQKRIYTLERLQGEVRHRGRSDSKSPIIGVITVQMLSVPTLRVVFVRDEKRPDQWIALASTDTELSGEQICQLYARRWAIEVFFKQTKQHLGLDSELQVRSYAACVAFTSIVFLRYMMLSYYQRQQEDDRSIPGLFYAGCQQLQALGLACCLHIIFLEGMYQLAKGTQTLHEAVTLLSGIVEGVAGNLQQNEIIMNPLIANCES